MKRALLLAYYFPPRMATGSLRATYLAKYLPRFGWQVTVVSARSLNGVPPPWATVIETGYTDVLERVKNLMGLPPDASAHTFFGSVSPKAGSRMTMKQRLVETAYRMLAFPDPQVGWFKHGVRAVAELLNAGSCDALISTSYPYTAHLIARRALAGKKTLWLADLRDAWRGNYRGIGIRSALHSVLERKTLGRANAITTVSAPLAHQLAVNNPTVPTFEIRNAFDPDDWIDIPFKRPRKFTLTYAGSLYQGLRDPEPLFDALMDEFQVGAMQRECVEIVFYANKEDWLEKAVERRGLQDVITMKGYVERSQVLGAERATSANLLLLRDNPDEAGVYTGKLFEYIGAGRPILTIGGPEQSVVRDVMARGGGWYARSPEEIRKALRALYQMHNSGSDFRLKGNTFGDFSAISMAQRFADLLENVRPE